MSIPFRRRTGLSRARRRSSVATSFKQQATRSYCLKPEACRLLLATHETEEQIAALQALLDRSFERAGVHTLSIIRPERRLNARQLVKYLEGMKHIVVGTGTWQAEPRGAP